MTKNGPYPPPPAARLTYRPGLPIRLSAEAEEARRRARGWHDFWQYFSYSAVTLGLLIVGGVLALLLDRGGLL